MSVTLARGTGRAAQREIRWTDARRFALRMRHSDNRGMTAAGRHIVEDFAGLSDSEKREVLANLLRISRDIEFPQVSDEELVASADALFLEYDRRESEQ